MRRLLLLILACAILLPSLAQAYDVLVLQSRRDPAFEEVVKGFRAVSVASQRLIVLSDYSEVDVVRIVREDRPKLILSVGDAALAAARKIQQTPVIALMALGVHTLSASQHNISGIGMFVVPEQYISIFQSLKSRRVGVVHNPAKTGWYVRQARQAAEKAGIQLVVREVAEPRDTLAQLAIMAGKVDALWMLPDATAVTRETTEAYFRFGQEQSLPVVSFASSYLGLGACAVLEIDRLEMGRQAGVMAAAILEKGIQTDLTIEAPHKILLKSNPGVMKRFGTSFDVLRPLSTR